jgi:hypothetical protein
MSGPALLSLLLAVEARSDSAEADDACAIRGAAASEASAAAPARVLRMRIGIPSLIWAGDNPFAGGAQARLLRCNNSVM